MRASYISLFHGYQFSVIEVRYSTFQHNMSPKRTYKIVGYKFLPFIVIFCLTTCRSNNIALRRNQFYYPIDSLTESKRLEICQVLTINICYTLSLLDWKWKLENYHSTSIKWINTSISVVQVSWLCHECYPQYEFCSNFYMSSLLIWKWEYLLALLQQEIKW